MKTILLLSAALCGLLLGACVASGPGYSGSATAVIGEDDYDYYPGSEVYYSPAHRYYYYRDGSAWVHRTDPPRAWARGNPSVRIHLHDAPERHHTDIVKQYPHTWRPGPDVHHDDHDRDRDRH